MLIRPVLTCDSECWTLTAKEGNLLHTFGIRILRKIMDQLRKGVCGEGVCVIVNCINCVMNQKQGMSSAQEY
jgi:hypothetical protein